MFVPWYLYTWRSSSRWRSPCRCVIWRPCRDVVTYAFFFFFPMCFFFHLALHSTSICSTMYTYSIYAYVRCLLDEIGLFLFYSEMPPNSSSCVRYRPGGSFFSPSLFVAPDCSVIIIQELLITSCSRHGRHDGYTTRHHVLYKRAAAAAERESSFAPLRLSL